MKTMLKKPAVKKPALKKFAAGGAVAKKKPVKKYADGGMLPVGSIAGSSTPQPDPTMLAMQQQMARDKAVVARAAPSMTPSKAQSAMMPAGSVAGPSLSTQASDARLAAAGAQMARDKAMAAGGRAPAPAPAPSPEYQRITNMLNADAAGAQARAAFQQRQKAFGTPAPRRRMAKGGVVAKMSTVKGKKK